MSLSARQDAQERKQQIFNSASMKAAQWDPAAQKVMINEVPVPEPGPGQFLVKLISASLCHSDLRSLEMPHRSPITLGHEGVGTIVRIGKSAEDKGFKIGNIIGFLYITGCCYDCEGCQIHNLLCQEKKPLLQGFEAPGFFAEYCVTDWQSSVVLPASLDPRKSSAIFCAGITAFHAIDSCELERGQWLAVVGAGGLGQLATQYAKCMGLRVIAVDINNDALHRCQNQGADFIFNCRSDTTYKSQLIKITAGGVHAAAVFSRSPAAFALTPGLIRIGGTMMIIGIPPEPVKVDALDLIMGKYKIKADSTGIPTRIKKALDFTTSHGICPDVEIRGGLEEVGGMVEDMKTGNSTRRMAVVFG